MDPKQVDLHVFITHFAPPKLTFFNVVKSIVLPRLSGAYARSWLRLLKHGTRGYQPWKQDTKRSILREINEKRLTYLSNQILILTQMGTKSLCITIHTNSEFLREYVLDNWPTFKIDVIIHPEYSHANVLSNPSHDVRKHSPWLLAWEHKKTLLKSLKYATKNSIFLVLEDDVIFSEANLRYFLEYKDILAKHSLLPSYCRVEFSQELSHYVAIDFFQSEQVSLDALPQVQVEGKFFVQLPNPYSGLIILDFELANSYVNSSAFSELQSRDLTWWGFGERAVMGLQFIGIPSGFDSRNVVLLDQSLRGVDTNAWILHQPNIYSRKRSFTKDLTPANLIE